MYSVILRHFRDIIRKQQPEKWKTKRWFLLHDNAPAHCSVVAKDLRKKQFYNTGALPILSLHGSS